MDKNYIFFDTTQSLCPKCKKLIDGKIVVEGKNVYMLKECKSHGKFKILLSTDADYYINSLKFNKPGQIPEHIEKRVSKGCPHDCGLCDAHEQHTCLGLIEITDCCNLDCPDCFAACSSKNKKPKFMSLEKFKELLEYYKKCEGEPQVLQISGGEPTLHPRILDMIKLAKKYVKHVILNTNGIRIANDETFCKELSKLTPNFEVYLQFDGLRKSTYLKLRKQDLLESKLKAIENLRENKIAITLAMTIKKGVNEDEIPNILRFALGKSYVRGICYQSLTCVGKSKSRADEKITTTEIIEQLEKTKILEKKDMIPLPCSHPHCCSLTYLLRKEGRVIPLTRLVDFNKNMDFIKNTMYTNPQHMVKQLGRKIFSMSFNSYKDLSGLSCCAPITAIFNKKKLSQFANHEMFRIVIKPFMDANTFETKRVMKCCIHFILPSKTLVPFCAYNTLYREKNIK
ncbi:MAG: radical SAM protein [Nanoarchaeota archaeon]